MSADGIREIRIHEEEGLTRIFVDYVSGALDHFGFTDDDRDISYRDRHDWSEPLKYMRPYTTREKFAVFFDGAIGVFIGLNVLAWIVGIAIGLIGFFLGAWSFPAFEKVLTGALMVDFWIISSLGIMALADTLPKYPNAFVIAPEAEQIAHRTLTDIWRRNDFRSAIAFESARH